MITVLFLASHIIRLAEPAVFSVRFSGELTRSEAREILHIAREHIAGRPGRILLDLALLNNVPVDCAQLIDELLAEARAEVPVRYVAIVRAQPRQRTFLPTSANEAEPLVIERDSDARPNLYLRYFVSPSDALMWLRLPEDLLWASHEAIYLTHYF